DALSTSTQFTLALLKPDLYSDPQAVESVLRAIAEAGNEDPIQIIARKRLLWRKSDAQQFYGEHEGKIFYQRLVGYMT
ncbi:hypothetical protein EV182_006297, partial [Spiromyces aspiralis]